MMDMKLTLTGPFSDIAFSFSVPSEQVLAARSPTELAWLIEDIGNRLATKMAEEVIRRN